MHGMGGWMDECLSVCLYVGSNLDPHNVQRSLTKNWQRVVLFPQCRHLRLQYDPSQHGNANRGFAQTFAACSFVAPPPPPLMLLLLQLPTLILFLLLLLRLRLRRRQLLALVQLPLLLR